jgi:translation initiation factor IF-2
MSHGPAGLGRPPGNLPPRTGPRRPGVGAGTAPSPTPRGAWPRQSGTARHGPVPAATAGRPAALGLAGTVSRKPGPVRRQPPVPRAAPAPRLAGPRLAGPRPAGPTPAPSRPGAGPPNRSGGTAAQRASLRIRNLILTTGGPRSASPLAARSPAPRRSSRPPIRGRRTRQAGTAGAAAGPQYGRRPRNGAPGTTRWPRPAAGGRPGRRGRAAGRGGAEAAGS